MTTKSFPALAIEHMQVNNSAVVTPSIRKPELAIRTAIDDGPANSVADLDELPGCPGCGKKVRVVIEYVEAPLPP